MMRRRRRVNAIVDAGITNIIVIRTGERDEILSKKSGKQEQYRLCGTSTTIP